MRDAAEFLRLLATLHDPDEGAEQTLEAIAEVATEVLGCDYAGVMLATRDGVESAAITDPVVARADQLQYRLHGGPCLSAIREGHVEIIQDTTASSRWPRWAKHAADLGILSSISVHLWDADGDCTHGSLNVYHGQTREFDSTDVEIAEILARHASAALADTGLIHGTNDAVSSRPSIGQAQGILMQQYGITDDRAFDVLRRLSQHTGRRVRDIAALIIRDRGRSDSGRGTA